MTDFDPDISRAAIIAGNGILPVEIFREMQKHKRKPMLIGVSGEIDSDLAVHADAVLGFGQLGKLFELLKQNDVHHLIFAGGIHRRPDIKSLKMDMATLKEVPTMLKIVMGGDNSILSKIAEYFARKNIIVVGAHQLVPGLLAGKGVICGKPALKTAMPMIEKAFKAAKMIGALDVGQAAIAEDGRVIALEAAEGTDGMIRRVGELRLSGRLSAKPKMGVLVKAMKPEQDMRADLPAIGPKTIDSVFAAGLKGIAVESGHTFILEREATLKRARELGIFIVGVSAVDFSS